MDVYIFVYHCAYPNLVDVCVLLITMRVLIYRCLCTLMRVI